MLRHVTPALLAVAFVLTIPRPTAVPVPGGVSADHHLTITVEGLYKELALTDPAGRICSPRADSAHVEFDGCDIATWEHLGRPPGDYDLFQILVRNARLGTHRISLVARESCTIDLQVLIEWRMRGKAHGHFDDRYLQMAPGDTLVCALTLRRRRPPGVEGLEVILTETRKPRAGGVAR